MSSTSVTFTGYVHDADGVAVQGAIINLYKKNTSTPSLGSSTSDATGLWTLSSSVSSVTSSGGDIKIAHPTSGAVLWRKYDDVVQYKSLNVGHIDITDTSGLSTLDIGTITVRDTASFIGKFGIGAEAYPTTARPISFAPAAITAPANSDFSWLLFSRAGAVTIPTGTSTHVATMKLVEPLISLEGTVTNASTLLIVDAPTEGTNNYALFVNSGLTRFNGDGTNLFEVPDSTNAGAATLKRRIPVTFTGDTGTTMYLHLYDS